MSRNLGYLPNISFRSPLLARLPAVASNLRGGFTALVYKPVHILLSTKAQNIILWSQEELADREAVNGHQGTEEGSGARGNPVIGREDNPSTSCATAKALPYLVWVRVMYGCGAAFIFVDMFEERDPYCFLDG
jgi:hypothetical protein